MKNRKIKRYTSVLLFICFFGLVIFLSTNIRQSSESLSTEQADALYGGTTNPTEYLYAGYIMDYSSLFGREVCGVTYLENGVAVSAAHCFEDDRVYFLGDGVISTSPDQNAPIIRYELHPEWNFDTLSNDIAIIKYNTSSTFNPITTKLGSPDISCDYEVIAYGATDQKVLSNQDLRRSATICIESISQDKFYLTSPDGGVCFGDSGSPIFRKGSGELVGVMSAITATSEPYSEDNCFVNNAAVATRVDAYSQFIDGAGQDLLSQDFCTSETPSCAGGEGCYSNQCRKPNDFLYISALDYRSANYAFGDALGLGLLGIFGVFGIIFIAIIVRSFRRTYY